MQRKSLCERVNDVADEQIMVESSTSVQVDRDPRFEQVTRALDVLQGATVEPDQEKRIQIGKQALALSRECVEAWLLLAREAVGDTAETKRCLEEAVAAGDRLFATRKETWRGKFWSVPQTRPYMQARTALGQVMWDTGEREEAIQVLEDTLALNPTDHQGVRYVLLKALLELDRYEQALELVSGYAEEQSTPMLYARLLTGYAVHGDSLIARSAFIAARKYNPYVLDYLLGLRVLPQKLPRAMKPGEESEAIRYAAVFGDVWERVSGVVDFLRSQKKLRTDKESRKRG